MQVNKDSYRKKIREAFESLDSQQAGYIGREEIEDSLIGLGLVDTPQEVDEIIKIIDSDGSNTIDFHEFFNVLKSPDNPEKSLMIFNSFKSSFIIKEVEFKGDTKKSTAKQLPFSLYVSQERREKLMAGIFYRDPEGLKRMEVMFKTIIGV